MPILIGAIAYRASPSDEVEEQIDSWQVPGDYARGARSEPVLCPRCSEPYILVEGIDAGDELVQDDMEFLPKALSTGHPSHPARMVMRDPDGVLYRHFKLHSTAAAEKGREEPASREVLTQP